MERVFFAGKLMWLMSASSYDDDGHEIFSFLMDGVALKTNASLKYRPSNFPSRDYTRQ